MLTLEAADEDHIIWFDLDYMRFITWQIVTAILPIKNKGKKNYRCNF